MKVLDLQCAYQHSFEGWFGSEEDFQSQLTRGLVECPLCGNNLIIKKLSAPRLNLGAVQIPDRSDAAPVALSTSVVTASAPSIEAQAAWMKMVRRVLANTEYVGSQFADEARKIHYGESKERNIRGEATAQETAALLDEGIDVLPLPIPVALKRSLQ